MELVRSTVWFLWVAFTAVAAVSVWLFHWQRARQDKRYRQSPVNDQPQVAVVTCLKGFDSKETPIFLKSLCCQKYSNYRLIFAFEDDQEPALEWIQTNLQDSFPSDDSSGPASVSVVVAGLTTRQGQKVHNQLAAFETLVAEDQIIAFADADIVCTPNWLEMLTSPINKDRFHIASGTRLPVPMNASLANLTATKLLSSIVTLVSSDFLNVSWGGSMAISREAFDKINVPEALSGCVNDDVRLANIAWRNGFPVGRRLSLMVASPVSFTWPTFWEFGVRQYYQVKKYSPFIFLSGLYPTTLTTIGFLSACVAAAMGNKVAMTVLVLTAGFDQVRAIGSRVAISACVDPQHLKFGWRMGVMQHLLTPYWMAVHAAIVLRAIPKRTITWAGITYQVVRQNQTRILKDPRRQPHADADPQPQRVA